MRCRPFVEKGDLGIKLEQTGDGPAGGEVNVINSKYTQTRFGFAYAWWSAHNAAKYCEKDKDIANGMEFIDQDKAYNACGEKVKENLLDGSAVVMFAYGLSGSGKTFTVFGPDAADSPDAWFKHKTPHAMWGILPRLAYTMFQEKGDDWKISMKYFQNVVDTVRDLTSSAAKEQAYKSGMRKDGDGFMDIDWCGKVPIDSWSHLCDFFQKCNARKAISPTQFNHQSTRGHCVMTLEVEKPMADNPSMKQRGRLYVCDLAGTEPAGDIFYAEYKKEKQADGSIEHILQGPHADQGKTKELQDQGKKINLSLSEMAQFFMKMAEAFKAKKLKPGVSISGCNSYFLCKYLKDTMMCAKTYLFCAIRPEVKFHPYTYSTLGFANNASVIKLSPKKATAGSSPMEKKLLAELAAMQELVKQLRAQLAAGGGGGAAGEAVSTLQRMETQIGEKKSALMQESDPTAAASAEQYERQKEHLKQRGITLASEIEDIATLNVPYLINVDEDPFRSGRMLCVLEKTPTTFGRTDADIRPPSMSIVQDHCSIDGVAKKLKVGKGRMFVNGNKIKSGQEVNLNAGDRVIIGAELFVFQTPGNAVDIDQDLAVSEYRETMADHSEYKDQFKKATRGLQGAGGKEISLNSGDANSLEAQMVEIYPLSVELEHLCMLMDREYVDFNVVLQSDKVTKAGKDDCSVKVKVINRNENPVQVVYLATFEFKRCYKILCDELYFLRDAVQAEEQYVVPFEHDPINLLFDATFHVGTAVMFPEFLVYNLETDASEKQLEVFPAAASGNQDINAGTLEVTWTPLPGEDGKVVDIGSEEELLGKPWKYKVHIKQALQLSMICDICYCEYEFFGGDLFATEAVEFDERPTRSPVLDYEYVHSVECVTKEFIAWLKEPLEIKVYISLDVKKPKALVSTENPKVYDLICKDLKKPAAKVRPDTGSKELEAEMQELQRKLAALVAENAEIKKANKRLTMQKRIAMAAARDAGVKQYPETGMAAIASAAANEPAPPTAEAEKKTEANGKKSSACVVQ